MVELGNISLSTDELRFLKEKCPYFNQNYLEFLKDLRLDPRTQVVATFTPDADTGSEDDVGEFHLDVKGLWIETILYEIPLLALTSEAYFRFMDRDWTYDGQEEKAFAKGMQLLEAGCVVSEFGSRRRRDYHTQALVFRGLIKAKKEAESRGLPGTISGTSNVHLAMRFNIPPIGTVAHEWFMGIAAITDNYETATVTALQYWIECFGVNTLGITLPDTFGTQSFLRSFAQPMPSSIATDQSKKMTFAEAYNGVRQDSGDPATFVQVMRDFYLSQTPPISPSTKTIVFSDSLNIDSCLEYKRVAESAGFKATFGIGSYFTNDFTFASTGGKSTPMNIVIKLSSADGRHAVKISDNRGKNTGDAAEVLRAKKAIGYVEAEWAGGDESNRWPGSKAEPRAGR